MKKIFRIALIVSVILLIPLILNILGGGADGKGFHWKIGDFIAMAILLFSSGLAIDFALKKFTKPFSRTIAILAIFLMLLIVWAELAVEAVSKFLLFISY